MKKILAVSLIIFLTISVYPGTGLRGDLQSSQPVSLLESLEPYGVVEKYRDSSQTGTVPVFLIQDIHAQSDAQFKIEKIILELEKKYGPIHILVEGASSPISADFFKSNPSPKTVQKVLRQYVERGELSGAEYAAATHRTDSDYQGIEDWPLYSHNRFLMLKGIELSGALISEMHRIDKFLEEQASLIFTKRTSEWLQKKKQYESGKITALEYIRFLKANFPEAYKKIPENSKLEELDKIAALWTQDLNSKADQERKVLIKRVQQIMKKTPSDFEDSHLLGQAAGAGLEMTDFSHIRMRADMKQKLGTIEGLEFLGELQSLEDSLLTAENMSQAELQMWKYIHTVDLMKKLFKFELSREEALEVLENPAVYDLAKFEKAFQKTFPEFAVREISEGGEAPAVFIPFYRAALEREEVFKERIGNSLREQKRPLAVVLGGFHTKGVEEYFETNQIPYLSVVPKAETLAEKGPYWSVMKGEGLSYYNQAGSQSALAPALVMASVVSNPEAFERLHLATGREIFDTLELYKQENNPIEYWEEWQARLRKLNPDPKLLQFYERIFFRLFIESLKTEVAYEKWDVSSPEIKENMREVLRTLNDLFLIKGTEAFEQKEIAARMLEGIQSIAAREDGGVGDILFLVNGARRGIDYQDIKDIFISYIKDEPLDTRLKEKYGETLDPKLAAYLREISDFDLYLLVFDFFYLAVPTDQTSLNERDAIIRDNYKKKKTFGEFLEETVFDSLQDPKFLMAVWLRMAHYPVEDTFQRLAKGGQVSKAIYESGKPNVFPPGTAVFQPEDGEVNFKIIDSLDGISLPRQQMIGKLQEVFIKLKRENEAQVWNIPIEDRTFELFEENINMLTDLRTQEKIINELKKISDFPLTKDERKRFDDEFNQTVMRIRINPSLLLDSEVRAVKKRKAEFDITMYAMAKGKYPQEIVSQYPSGLFYAEDVNSFIKKLQKISLIVQKIENRPVPEAFAKVKEWANESERNMILLWKYIKARNYFTQYQLSLISDPNYDVRWLSRSAYVHPIFQPDPLPLITSSWQNIWKNWEAAESTFRGVRLRSPQTSIYYIVEYLDKYSQLQKLDPKKWEEVAEIDLTGILREEMAHTNPMEESFLWRPDIVEYEDRLRELLKEMNYEEEKIELEIRRLTTGPRDPKDYAQRESFINFDEGIAKWMRGGGTIEGLVRHWANHLYVFFAVGKDVGIDFYLGRAKNFLRHYYSEFPWIHLKLPESQAVGYLAPYRGKSIYDAIIGETTRVFNEWETIKGKSLGSKDKKFELSDAAALSHDLPAVTLANFLLARKAELSSLTNEDLDRVITEDQYEAIRQALIKWLMGNMSLVQLEDELSVLDDFRDEFRQILKQEFPERYSIDRRLLADNEARQTTDDFWGEHPELRGETAGINREDLEALNDTPFAKLITEKTAEGAKSSSIFFLPSELPENSDALYEVMELLRDRQNLVFYEVEQNLLKNAVRLSQVKSELLQSGISSDAKIQLQDKLRRSVIERPRDFKQMRSDLIKEVKRSLRKEKGITIFGKDEALREALPPSEDVVYIMMDDEVSGFGWLNQEIKKIGFVVPTLNTEEAEKFSQDLRGYGIGFEKTDRGILIRIDNLEALLETIGQEFEAARARAIAA